MKYFCNQADWLHYILLGGYEIAALSAGGVLKAVEAVIAGEVDNAYCLVRPPGHHAERDRGMGFCLFNNIALGALHARTLKTKTGLSVQRIAIIDYDVHHGNGTQQAFYDDSDCLFISLHQDNNYPQGECGSRCSLTFLLSI
jgi:acetoin utilization deacetylase AcuC-like enzyme